MSSCDLLFASDSSIRESGAVDVVGGCLSVIALLESAVVGGGRECLLDMDLEGFGELARGG